MNQESKISYVGKISCPSEMVQNRLLSQNPLNILPLGAIQCKDGWLKEQLVLLAQGITGRLPEYGPFFRYEANGFLYPEINNGWEEIPYWLRGYYPLAVLVGDQHMLDIAQEYIEAIFASVQDDGWFGPAYLKTYEKTADNLPVPDFFPNMILLDTLVLYYKHTHDKRVLELVKKFIHFCMKVPDKAFFPKSNSRLKWQKIRSGDMLTNLYWYYRESNDGDALILARRVYHSIYKSTNSYIATHAVDFAQRFAYDAIYSQQSGAAEHFAKSEYEYEKFAEVWGQMPRGIFAADERIRNGATDPRQAFEPCAMVELSKNFYELGRISGDTKFADQTEDVMLNHYTASYSPDYKQIHYLTSANMPQLSNNYDSPTYNGSFFHQRSFTIYTPNNRCCGYNAGMGWPWYVMNLWQSTWDGGLAAFLYASCEVDTVVSGQHIQLKVTTDYPFKGNVHITVNSDGKYPLYFRVPSWSSDNCVSINGKQVFANKEKGGWICILRDWNSGDEIDIEFGMEISLTRWRGNGSVSVDRGPLSYSVRIKEEYKIIEDAGAYNHPEPHLWENYEVCPKSPWNYGLSVNDDVLSNTVKIIHVADELAAQPWNEVDAPIVLKALARRIPLWKLQDGTAAELQQSPVNSSEPLEEIELIPLGCARLRISCFPVVTDNPKAEPWREVPNHIDLEKRPEKYPYGYDFFQDADDTSFADLEV